MDALKQLEKPFVKACHVVMDAMDGETKEELQRGRIACAVLSAYTRTLQAKGAQTATRFMAAREVLSDQAALEEYISASMPELQMAPAITMQRENRSSLAEQLPSPEILSQ
jgi:hypothetical protein